MSWLAAVRARLRLIFARRAAETRMDEEVAFHIEMESDRLMREERLSAGEARRRALVTFGGITQHKEELRDGRGLAWLGGASLDMKLGFRMLLKYPGLTIVGGLAMAFAIWAGAVIFVLVTMLVNPTLPLPGGDRIVQIRNWDVAASAAEPRALHDFIVWREAVSSVTDLGAYRDVTTNLIVTDGDTRQVRQVQVAEITASGFRIASATPLFGRVIVAADERVGAPAVAILGYDVWRTQFDADRNVLGRTVQVGETYATVIGVMPEGFAFPVSHELWTPLRVDALDRAPREGPAITVFGRLAPGVTMQQAQAELTTLGKRSAVELPNTHEHLQPQVLPYAKLFLDATPLNVAILFSINVFAIMLLVLVCSNVALLLFARAATRENELVVRSALGASRGRIIAQLFAEALVLGGVAALLGLAAADLVLHGWALQFLKENFGRLPFWYDPHLSVATVLYASVLTLLSATIAGVLPALKITRGFGSRLRAGSAGGGGLQFGGVWTAVIIAQIAITVAFPALAFVEQRELLRIRSFDAGFRSQEYLAVMLDMDESIGAGANADAIQAPERERFVAAVEGLRRRVAAEPGVAGVTFVDRLPRWYHRERLIELDDALTVPGQSGAGERLREVSTASIDPSYFDVLNAPILEGRAFNSGDLAPGARAVIVDQSFVDQVLSGRNAIGQRVRFAAMQRDGNLPDESRPWYEIVGVVKELGMGAATQHGRAAGLYLPAIPGSGGPINMIVHVRGEPMSLAPRVQTLASRVDPTLRVSEPQRLDEITNGVQWVLGMWLRVTVLLTAIALLLSLAGIYAVLSFIVARRTREIGVRVALGASPRRVVAAIFRRPLTQVCLGVLAGGMLIGVAAVALSGGGFSLAQVGALVAYACLMLAVCSLACVVPTWRALRVEPTEALRAE
jgi:putative ABC transport system permease protein